MSNREYVNIKPFHGSAIWRGNGTIHHFIARVSRFRVLLCALTEDCIAPGGSELTCKFKDRYKDYGNCHRFDQSLFALARLHLVYLQGYNKLLHPEDRLPEVNSEAKESHMSAEQLKTLSTERERRYQAFVSCFVISRGDEYDGAIPSCNVSSTIDKP